MYAYNPRKKSSEELSQSLVGADRWDILNGILGELALKKGESPKQHWMLVGARGMGKSHLLTLLHHKVCADKKLSKLWIPVLFPEEIRMAGDLAKFLERAISEVQRDLEREKSPVAVDLKEKIVGIRTIRHDERVEYLFSLMTWIRRETGRHILLIAENLQQLLGKKISLIDQKKLRAFLQSEDALLLIGSATTIFTALHDHSHPFYHFFHIRRLQELSFEDIKTLVGNLLSGHDKQERTRIMTENEARLRVIHSFTGGNPRMAVFLSDIIKTDINEEMIHIMDRILDELTPYFEAIINDTPEYLHDIINTLAAFEPAQSPKEIAEHLEMEQGTVRNYLKQAKESGYVRVAFSRGKSNYYCLNEYLYRAWFQMRDSGHREDMRWLMELMMFLYSREHILAEKERIEKLEINAGNYYHQLVMQTYDFMVTNPAFCAAVNTCIQQPNVRENKSAKDQMAALIDLRIKNVKKEIKNRVEELNKSDKFNKREYMKKVVQIIIDCTIDKNDNNISILISHLLAISLYFKNTYDINTSVDYYSNNILSLQKNYKHEILSVINTNVNIDKLNGIELLVYVAMEDYDHALNIVRKLKNKIDNKIITAFFSVIKIQIVYHANKHNYDQMFASYDALLSICQEIGQDDKEFSLYFTLIISEKIGLITEESIETLIKHSIPTNKKIFILAQLWTCIKEPDSELAQKLMAEPPVKKLIGQIRAVLDDAVEQEKLP